MKHNLVVGGCFATRDWFRGEYMTLAEFMAEKKLSDAEVGRRLGALLLPSCTIPRVTIRQWRVGVRVPRSKAVIAAIQKLSENRVTLHEVMGLPDPGRAQSARASA